jgi:hypothetical protein
VEDGATKPPLIPNPLTPKPLPYKAYSSKLHTTDAEPPVPAIHRRNKLRRVLANGIKGKKYKNEVIQTK